MGKYIDLHTHSLKSDGSMTPAEVVQEAKRAGLAAIALSDHDTVDGLEEAIAEGKKLKKGDKVYAVWMNKSIAM